MGWLLIPNNRLWEYDNAPADPGANSPYRPLWLKQTAGVRIHTDPAGKEHKVYTKVRKVGSDVDTMGEIAKTYWDVKGDDLKFQMEVLIPSDDLSFTIPCQEDGGVVFDAIIDWGDGATTTSDTYNGNGLAHTYSAGGTYTIKIDGTFPNIYFNNIEAGDKDKVKKILNLGHVGWTKLNNAFHGCVNLTEFSAGASDTSSVTTLVAMLSGCIVLTTAEVRLDTSSVTTLASMFSNVPLTDLPGIDTWDISSFTPKQPGNTNIWTDNMSLFMTNGGYNLNVGRIATETYDAMLIAWAAQAPNIPSIGDVKFGLSEFTAGGEAADARAVLVNAFGGDTLTDGDSASNSTFKDGGEA